MRIAHNHLHVCLIDRNRSCRNILHIYHKRDRIHPISTSLDIRENDIFYPNRLIARNTFFRLNPHIQDRPYATRECGIIRRHTNHTNLTIPQLLGLQLMIAASTCQTCLVQIEGQTFRQDHIHLKCSHLALVGQIQRENCTNLRLDFSTFDRNRILLFCSHQDL